MKKHLKLFLFLFTFLLLSAVAFASISEQQKLQDGSGSGGDLYGYGDISSDGTMAIIGADGHGLGGAAYIYTRSGLTWSLDQKITASDALSGDDFGTSVAIADSNDYVIIGANRDDDPVEGSNAGSAYIFAYSATGATWVEEQKLIATDIQSSAFFGYSVDIADNGTHVVIGADNDDNAQGSGAGAAYVFLNTAGTWSEQAKLINPGGAAGQNLGFDIAMSDDALYVVIGTAEESAGQAVVFVRSGVSWSFQQELSGGGASSGYGRSVGISSAGDYIIVGDNVDNSNTGTAFIYNRSVSTWSEQQQVFAASGTATDGFGSSVDVSGGGDYALIAANGYQGGDYMGTAYTFTRAGSTWSEQDQFLTSDGASFDYLGEFGTAAISDNQYALVGAPNESSGQGAAYIFVGTEAVTQIPEFGTVTLLATLAFGVFFIFARKKQLFAPKNTN